MGAYENQITATGGVIFVDKDATGSNNGTSWTDAYTDLQSALSKALNAQVWVAEGIYYPASDASDRSAAFLLKRGVAVYGGFAGTETLLSQRDWQAHPTVLSGDLERNDTVDARGVLTSTAGILGSNAYHVVVGSGITQTAVLDGFFITGGQANSASDPYRNGGGLWLDGSNPLLSYLWFSGNQASNYGAGLFANVSSPAMSNITFSGNQAANGAGMYAANSSSLMSNMTFSGNQAANGGGIYLNASSPQISYITFSGNQASNRGGGYLPSNASSPLLSYFTFSANQSEDHGGGLAIANSVSMTLTNGIFNGNLSQRYGGGISNSKAILSC